MTFLWLMRKNLPPDQSKLLSELGNVSDKLRIKVRNQKDTNMLKKWVRLVDMADSIEDFKQNMEVNL